MKKEFELKNRTKLIIKSSETADAEAIIDVMKTADSETMFLARNPGEFNFSIEQERMLIEDISQSNTRAWFNPVVDNKIVGQCSVALVNINERFLHRAEVAFVLLKEYWGMGIGGKMMETCLDWCRERNIEQVELEVLTGNERALSMYKSFGFEITGIIPHALKYLDGSYGDEYKMVKYL